MKRWLAVLGWDVRSQFRQGLYYAAAVVVVIWVATLAPLSKEMQDWLFPAAIYMDMSVFGFYFMAAILFLEKADGVLDALVVTPLHPVEYLLSKIASLTLIALLASIAVVLAIHGAQVQWHWLVLGVVVNSWFLALFGFMLAARYNGISEFLVPSVIFTLPAMLPLLDYLGVWQGWPLYLLPPQGSMIMLAAALQPVDGWKLVYGVVYSLAACLVATVLAVRTFERFVVRAERRG